MEINLSQQVSATFARNHFKEICDKALREGKCFVIKKSKPAFVILPIEEFRKIKESKKIVKKMSLEELRKKSRFKDFQGCLKKAFPNKTSLELQSEWYKYVD